MAKKGEGDRWELMRIIGWGWYGQKVLELIGIYIISICPRTYRSREKKRGGVCIQVFRVQNCFFEEKCIR